MADKVIGIKIVLDGEQSLSDLDKELIKVNKELKLMQAQQKALNKDFENVDKSTKAYDDLLKKEIDLKRQIKETSTAQKELNKTFEYTKVAAGSYNELQGELRQLTKEFKALSEAERNADVGKNTVNKINELKTQLKELDKGIGDNFRNVGNYTESINASLGNFKAGFADVFNVFSAAGAGAFAANAVMDFVKGSVTAFNEAENAAAQLENVIVNIGGESSAAFERLLTQADELEAKTFGFTAEQIQEQQAALSVFGLTVAEIEKLTPLILDYATVTGKDLNTATGDVTNALLGKTKALQEVGISLDKDNISVETLTASLERFGGSAERALDVGTNKLEVLSDTVGKVQESVGGFIANYLIKLIRIFDFVGESVDGVSRKFKAFGPALQVFGQTLVSVFLPFTAIIDVLDSAVSKVQQLTGIGQKTVTKLGRGSGGGLLDNFASGVSNIVKGNLSGGDGGTGNGSNSTGNPEKMKAEAEAIQAVADSYEGLNKQLSALREKYNLLSEAERNGEVGQTIINNTIAIKQQLDVINNDIKEAEKTAEEQKRAAIIQEKYKTFGEIQKLDSLFQAEQIKAIDDNTNEVLNEIALRAQKLSEAQMKASEETYQTEKGQLQQIENAKNQIQAQAFDFALLASKAFGEARLNQLKQDYDKENELLKKALDNNQITQSQYDKEKLANDKKQSEEEIKIRKQNAAVQKTITLAEIALNLAKELSQINSNIVVTSDLTQLLRTTLTIAAIGRATLQASQVLSQKFAKGGLVEGNSHEAGGVKGYIGNRAIELEGGEAVINKRSTEMFKPLLSRINESGGGKRFAAGGLIPYAYSSGGGLAGDNAEILKLIAAVNGRIDRLQVIQSVTQLTDVQNNQKKVFQDSRI